jgi:hypothetical protein
MDYPGILECFKGIGFQSGRKDSDIFQRRITRQAWMVFRTKRIICLGQSDLLSRILKSFNGIAFQKRTFFKTRAVSGAMKGWDVSHLDGYAGKG